MIDRARIRDVYSADVRLTFVVGERTVRLAKIGPQYIVPREALEIPPCEGEIVMLVDGWERRWKVRLPHGAVPFERDVLAETISSE